MPFALQAYKAAAKHWANACKRTGVTTATVAVGTTSASAIWAALSPL
jgi:hypothetical protein